MTIDAIVFDAYGTLYDVQSVATATNEAFPGYGDFITQVWRVKQLEYSWLRSMMGQYVDFGRITRDALAFTLDVLGLQAEPTLLEQLAEKYNHLTPYPETRPALQALSGHRLAILSNGSPDMLQALVHNSGMTDLIGTILSVDAKRVFKPDPRAYALVEERFGISPENVLFVSSNGFDVRGAKSFGFKVARIERVSPQQLQAELADPGAITPGAVVRALRTQDEHLGQPPDFVVHSLHDLVGLAAAESKDRR